MGVFSAEMGKEGGTGERFWGLGLWGLSIFDAGIEMECKGWDLDL